MEGRPDWVIGETDHWIIEEDAYRCKACGYSVKADPTYDKPPESCENCEELASGTSAPAG